MPGLSLGEFTRALICAHLFGREYGPQKFVALSPEESLVASTWEATNDEADDPVAFFMSNATYLFNFLGCLEKYRDLNTAANWLRRASQELAADQFNDLGSSIHHWLLKNKNYHDLAEPIYKILSDFFPSSELEWHARFRRSFTKSLRSSFVLKRTRVP